MNKIQRLEHEIEVLRGNKAGVKTLEQPIEQSEQPIEKPTKKKFKLPPIIKKLSKKSNKNPEYVLVQHLTLKQQVEFKLCRIVSGDIIVIRNKAHTLDPRDVWRHGKHLWYIIREMDRRPVSNRDYKDVKERGDDTDADVPLIKAVLGAINKPNPLQSKSIIIWIIGGVVAAVVLFTFLK